MRFYQNRPSDFSSGRSLIKNDMSEAEEVTIKKSTYKKLIYTIVIASLLLSFLLGYQVGNFDSNIPTVQESIGSQIQNSQGSNQPSTNTLIQLTIDDDPLLGDINAPITIIEYGDFQCPFCKRFHDETLPLIKSNYIDKGLINMVWKDFPLQSIHKNAIITSIAGECADDQGLFWELHDKIFDEQANWQGLPISITINEIKGYASEIGINQEQFNNCLDSEKYLDEVSDDFNTARSFVSGTPAFFIGNEETGFVKLTGAQPFSVFQSVIESLLPK